MSRNVVPCIACSKSLPILCVYGVAVCPRHGANIDIRSGRALTLPAVESVATYPVRVVDGMVKVQIA